MIYLLKVFVFLNFISVPLFAERFENHFISFQKPAGWECELVKTEWICQHENPERQREALIIFAAKIRSDDDSLGAYSAHLKKNKVLKMSDGSQRVSRVQYTKMRRVNDQSYVDSLHYESEIVGYYTRYLATVKADMGIVITFTVLKSKFPLYRKTFENVLNSMRVYNKRTDYPKLGKKRKSSVLDGANLARGTEGYGARVGDVGAPGKGKKEIGGSGISDDTWMYIVMLLAIVGYIFVRRRNSF